MASETVADIVKIMRGAIYPVSRCPDLTMRGYADRIEAAHQREVAEPKRQREEALTIVNEVEKCASIERHTEAMLKKNEVIAGLRKQVAELEAKLSNTETARKFFARRVNSAKKQVAELRNGMSELLDALQTIYEEECTDYGTGEVYDKWRKALGEEGGAK